MLRPFSDVSVSSAKWEVFFCQMRLIYSCLDRPGLSDCATRDGIVSIRDLSIQTVHKTGICWHTRGPCSNVISHANVVQRTPVVLYQFYNCTVQLGCLVVGCMSLYGPNDYSPTQKLSKRTIQNVSVYY